MAHPFRPDHVAPAPPAWLACPPSARSGVSEPAAIPRRTSIGVFDSGVGGLTVLKALLEVVREADYLYFGDTARLPYGSKSMATVSKYAIAAARYLEHHHAQMLVIACNTATALALDAITRAVPIPVIGVIEPGAEQAASESKNRKVVVIGTEATISSHAYQKALESRGMAVREKACPLFVPLVEEGWTEHPVSEQVAGIYLAEAFSGGYESADVLLLGCTHYPLLTPLLRRLTPRHAAIIDSAHSTAQAVAKLACKVRRGNLGLNERRHAPRLRFFATDSLEKFRCLGTRFLGQAIDDVQHLDLRE
jgi:glutamate racemase